MEILFRTKKEAKEAQEDYFLSLSPAERFYHFLAMSQKSQHLFPKKVKNTDNFIIKIPPKHGE